MEYIEFFNEVQNHLDAELPLVIFKKPNEKKICGFLQHSNALRVGSEFEKGGFVFSPFVEAKDQTVWMYADECKFINASLKSDEVSYLSQKKYPPNTNAKLQHVSIVQKAINKLTSGALQKVVISRSEFLKVNKTEPIEWFKRIINLYANTFCYCWYHPKVGMWLGATPETLISLSKTKFQTMALAGTMPFEGTESVSWGNKEKEEQQMVVDSILEALKPVTKQVDKGVTITQKAGSLLHLKTVISGELNAANNLKVLIEVLHPTSAVCGLPKVKSKEFILVNENYNRSYYTGYLGRFSPEGNTHLFVNLRCMQVHKNSVEIYVGGGITARSEADSEWVETVNKSETMKKVL